MITRYNLAVAPSVREIIKNKAPVLYDINSKTVLQIIINGGKIQPVIKWQQYKSNHNITQQITDHHLEIRKTCRTYCTGTDTNVTPLSEVPIIPNATSIQLEFLFPIKKESLLELREVILGNDQ